MSINILWSLCFWWLILSSFQIDNCNNGFIFTAAVAAAVVVVVIAAAVIVVAATAAAAATAKRQRPALLVLQLIALLIPLLSAFSVYSSSITSFSFISWTESLMRVFALLTFLGSCM